MCQRDTLHQDYRCRECNTETPMLPVSFAFGGGMTNAHARAKVQKRIDAARKLSRNDG